MSKLNYHLLNNIPSYYRNALGYYPDMLVYQHNAKQYEQHWQKLIHAKYIYTNGYNLKPVGILRYTFELFKGWLGYNNHCEPQKVQLSLCKFAYYGYLNNYSQNVLQQPLTSYKIPEQYLKLVKNSRNAATSKTLQDLLISYYRSNSNSIPQIPTLPFTSYYAFGDCFKFIEQWAEIPRLDPQSHNLITTTFHKLEYELAIKDYPFYPGSYYAELTAQSYLDRAKDKKNSLLYRWSWFSDAQQQTHYHLQRAIFFNPNIINQNLTLYIDYFLEKRELEQAFNLITQLPDLKQAANYIILHYEAANQLALIKPNTPLAKELAQYYIQKKTLIDVQLATQLDTELAQTNPVDIFHLSIAEKQYDKAYDLWLINHNKYSFDSNDLIKLGNYFNELGEQAYVKGKAYRKAEQWQKATLAYQQSFEAKRKALKVNPTEERKEQYFIHMRLYAQLLIHTNLKQHQPAQSNIAEIEKAIKLLDKCVSKVVDKEEKQLLSKALAKGLMRQVDYLVHLFLVPADYDSDRDTRIQHKTKHQTHFTLALDALHRITKLLTGCKDPKQKKLLGKAYFLLGDIANFFDLNLPYAEYFKKAMEIVPSNPFYLLRCSELFEERQEDLRSVALPLLKKRGFTTIDYYNWYKERWEQETYRTSPIKDIHSLDIAVNPPAPRFAFL
ncbi:Uncharacterised protein [Legionella busanensis]|uniref:Uncharacterized protein n=1 Tax=Legionella busanensis TaxID=190655 RepID=A0A378JGU0_9GAMM|nr:hypothetical protein [Legionella busanensis]STX50395.1 Uncharacterised protein [Legionella busanensis]